MKDLHRHLAVAAAGLAVLAGAAWSVYDLTDAGAAAGPGEALTLYDARDARQVAGTADDVFAGSVVERRGQRDIHGVLSDLYDVRVSRAFQGDLRGTVTVSYAQGEEPLAAGASYVFATGRVPHEPSHAVLLETTPARFTSLTAPAPVPYAVAGATGGQSVAEYWTWAVQHKIDVSPR
ncbi:hypothetical protein [Streptomyces luteocolor]|uniref:hypothetical protein n=1 Tax=Streptomyces luteocolor TaxID=285500 RepID=UPI00085307FB|nr:hypothetical protein [Streptomyces luteocolor]